MLCQANSCRRSRYVTSSRFQLGIGLGKGKGVGQGVGQGEGQGADVGKGEGKDTGKGKDTDRGLSPIQEPNLGYSPLPRIFLITLWRSCSGVSSPS